MKSESVKVGIIGLGRWAKVLTRAAQKSTKFSIVAGYSRSEEKRQSYQEEFGITAAPNIETLLENPEIKGVILTVPNEQHLPVAEQAAKAGKQVYTEKPIANTVSEADRLVVAPERSQHHSRCRRRSPGKGVAGRNQPGICITGKICRFGSAVDDNDLVAIAKQFPRTGDTGEAGSKNDKPHDRKFVSRWQR